MANEKTVPHTQYLPVNAKITRAEKMTAKEKFFEIQLPGGKDLGHKPGQFVEVSLLGIGEAPISVSSSPTKKGSFDLVVREVGNVTAALHKLEAGATVGIRGPFGNGFDMSQFKGKDLVIVGGGIGLVPLRSTINYALDNRGEFGKVSILYGTRNPSEILFKNEIAQWEARKDIDFCMTVDRGDATWKGNVGVITTLIPPLKLDLGNTAVVVCGPPIMYKFVIMSLQAKQLSNEQIWLSLERRMKCGLGKCGHCQMNHLYVCQEGPVFNYAQITDVKEAI
ncbi:MAG: FAD/NAD(P)-binding protein [Myxococcota bacterium]|jgi:sulfite reductase subunit B